MAVRRPPAPFVCPLDMAAHAVCGCDEAGRGPLAGNVVAACVLLDPERIPAGVADSKTLSPARREHLAALIRAQTLAYGVGECTPDEIDRLNILRASLEAMRRAYVNMGRACELLLADGPYVPPGLPLPALAVIKGDARVACIAAASILAKVTRDAEMAALDARYPQYGFARHKGYPTPAHLTRLRDLPVLPCYRRTFAPVRELLARRDPGGDDRAALRAGSS